MSIENNRHHRERMKARRRHHWGRELDGKELGKAINTPAPCSCWGCGNARATEGLTRQELMAKQ